MVFADEFLASGNEPMNGFALTLYSRGILMKALQ